MKRKIDFQFGGKMSLRTGIGKPETACLQNNFEIFVSVILKIFSPVINRLGFQNNSYIFFHLFNNELHLITLFSRMYDKMFREWLGVYVSTCLRGFCQSYNSHTNPA